MHIVQTTNTIQKTVQTGRLPIDMSDDSTVIIGILGVVGLLVVIGIASGFKEFFIQASRSLFSKLSKPNKRHSKHKKLIQLHEHTFFIFMDNYINVNIHNINHPCALRRAVFTDMLVIKLECVRSEILKIIESPEYFTLDRDHFKEVWSQVNNSITMCWNNKCSEAGIFQFALDKLTENCNTSKEIINELIDYICDDTLLNLDTYAKTTMILDVFKSVHYSILVNTLEDTFKGVNGSFIKKSYKSTTCTECHACNSNWDEG